eukprot:3434761-Rhodomonas_salina.1
MKWEGERGAWARSSEELREMLGTHPFSVFCVSWNFLCALHGTFYVRCKECPVYLSYAFAVGSLFELSGIICYIVRCVRCCHLDLDPLAP